MKQTDEEDNIYYTPTQEQLEESGGRLDLSWRGLSGNFRVANLKNLHTLNLGHNSISQVVIRNCPNLTRAIVWNCPKLDEGKQEQEGFWYFGNPNLVIEHADKDLKDEVSLKSDEIDPTQTFKPKPKKTEQEELHDEIAFLLIKAQRALEGKDLTKLTEIVKELKELAEKVTDNQLKSRIQAQINKFESALLASQTVKSEPIPYKLIIGLGDFLFLLLGLLFLLANRMIKKLLMISIFPINYQKKKKQS